MAMAFYFMGTGNSRYLARRIAEGLGDACICYCPKEAIEYGNEYGKKSKGKPSAARARVAFGLQVCYTANRINGNEVLPK